MTGLPNNPRPYRRLLWLFGLLALVMSFASVALVHQYGATRPTTANDARTHATKIHDRTVYLTGGEFAAAVGTHVAALGCMAIFLGVLMRSRFSKSAHSQTTA